ncbi:MAG TPA: hypothetical protein PLH19_06400 [Anaerolineae bacterium]|nr:hypothetical protein [Anaerolineae bacterium]HQH38151.1 hypothetical protein [Anaerolineae bacterium]
MRDPITARAAQLLMQSQHILVPVTDLYNALATEGLMSQMDLEMFVYLIASDHAFEILGGLEDLEVFSSLLRAELEVQGFGSGPLVMLRHRATKPTAVIQDALMHLHEMNVALESAWKTRPADDPEIEAELIQMLLMSDMLTREIEEVLHSYAASEDTTAPNTPEIGGR